ncbi:MAG TPA: hypothetical protein VF469_15900, partial [Kofleriaceae bacterium]
DAYFGTGPFHVTVRAGLVIGKKPERRVAERPPEAPSDGSDGSDGVPDALSADSITAPVPLTCDFDDPFDHIETGLVDEDSQELDALGAGSKRPHHLVD